jgi:hypothetical protein
VDLLAFISIVLAAVPLFRQREYTVREILASR